MQQVPTHRGTVKFHKASWKRVVHSSRDSTLAEQCRQLLQKLTENRHVSCAVPTVDLLELFRGEIKFVIAECFIIVIDKVTPNLLIVQN